MDCVTYVSHNIKMAVNTAEDASIFLLLQICFVNAGNAAKSYMPSHELSMGLDKNDMVLN